MHVLAEVKGLKTSLVPLDLFKDVMKTKAGAFKDVMKTKAGALELKRLVSSLSETMGNLNAGKMLAGDASIVFMRLSSV